MPPVRRRLTATDEHMAHWIARWAPVTAMQVARRFARPRRQTYRRLGALASAGLVRREPRIADLPGALYPTARLLTGPVPRKLPATRLATHFAAVQHVVALELDGRVLVPASELSALDSLLALLPRHDGAPILPAAAAVDGSPMAIYCTVRGSEEGRRLVACLAASLEPTNLACRLLADPAFPLIASPPAWLEVLPADLAAVRDAGS